MINPLTIIVPNKAGDNPKVTIESLYRQTWKFFDIVIVNDFDGNANAARNKGLSMVKSEFVLFSDNDIEWDERAIWVMMNTLHSNPLASYCYGWYEMNGKQWCRQQWDSAKLRQKNFVSTMSIVRTMHHPGWDEKIRRLQDWDVWLTMLGKGRHGIFCGQRIFTTKVRDGITYNSGVSYEEAHKAIKSKHFSY